MLSQSSCGYSLGLILFVLLRGAAPACAEPGEEAVLSSGTAAARLYLVETHRASGGEIIALRLAWLPQDIAALCLGKDYKHCGNLDQCVVWGQNNDGCARAGLAKEKIPRRKPGARPPRLLAELITEKERLHELVRRWGLKPGREGVDRVAALSRSRAVSARVLWEEWTNGMNFRIKELSK